MSGIDSIYGSAELSLASYSTLVSGVPTNAAAQKEALIAQGFTAQHADEFASRFPTIVTQFNDTPAEGGMGTSFSATVFKDASTPGQLSLAIRGTLELSGTPNDLIPTDANIFVNGAGYDQIVSMFNWWKRSTAIAGEMVVQHRIVAYASTVVPPANATFLYPGAGVLFYLEPAPDAVATGVLRDELAADPDLKIDVTGHSLGGHLALAFNKLFASVTGQVTAFNAPGFIDSTTNQAFFSRLGGVVPMKKHEKA